MGFLFCKVSLKLDSEREAFNQNFIVLQQIWKSSIRLSLFTACFLPKIRKQKGQCATLLYIFNKTKDHIILDMNCWKDSIPVSSWYMYLINFTLSLTIKDKAMNATHLISLVPPTNSMWLVMRKLHHREVRQFVEGLGLNT